MNSELCFLYVTTTNNENAKHLSRILLQEKLIACANILPQMEALYWWEGKIEEGSEALMILKTTRDKIDLVRAKLKTIHPYQTPCIAEIHIDSMNAEYQNWILNSLK
ncbi:MAG: divalent-cation tolerance protein CutA [Oligoflexia bacterium]|nr:MAG: divalent-cation tolerance protein CutA [Oligoflexia bacterium]